MPTRLEQRTKAFFKAHSKRTNDAIKDPPIEDVDGVIASFAAHFVDSSPVGVAGAKNGFLFKRMIPHGYKKYRKMGAKRFEAVGIEATQIDQLHAMAKVDWEFDYVRPKDGGAGTIAFQNIYIVTFADGEPKIIASITPDENKALAAAGLV